jgi:23S rRNA pseudouridine2605 synthase
MNNIRLNKFISNSGHTSRRKADELIFEGKVKVNNIIVLEPGKQIDPTQDKVEIEDKIINLTEQNIYIMLNKPTKYVSTVKDQFDRPSVVDLININERVYPVGRLDYDSHGLLLMTNDGELTYKLTHPRHDVSKTYIAKIIGDINEETLEKIRKGIYIDNYRTRPCKANIISKTPKYTEVRVSIMEGRNRQIRKMFEKFGFRVIDLQRIAIGDISIGELSAGQWRYLTDKEVDYLRNVL